MTNVEIMKGYRMMLLEAFALKEQADDVVMIGTPRGVGSQELTGIKVQGNNDPVGTSIMQSDRYLERLREKYEELIRICNTFEDVLETIKDRRERVICRMYYGTGATDEKIAEKLNLETRTVCMIRNSALEKI